MMPNSEISDNSVKTANKNQKNVSQLSSALRHVNINSGQALNDQSNLQYGGITRDEMQEHQRNEQMQNLQQQTIAEGQQLPQEQRMHISDMTSPISVQGQMQQQINNPPNIFPNGLAPGQDSRISQFFQNQPMEGYTLFSHRSAPNGYKVSMVLSELGLQFNTIFLDFNAGEHRAPEFVSVNPNARVPALIDHGLDNLGLWESGAILLHLVNKYYKETGEPLLWADNLSDQSQINAWLFFQTSGHAPMIGQALHFKYFHSQKISSAVERYTDEVRRVYGVLEVALTERREATIMEMDTENAASYSAGTTPISQSKFFDYPVWLVGDNITIADISFLPWNNVIDKIGINIKAEFPEVYKWTKNMMRRPAIVQALRGD